MERRLLPEAARAQGVSVVPADKVESFPGRGIRGIVGGRPIWVGGPGLMRETGEPFDAAIVSHVEALESRGKTVVVVGAEKPLGLIVIADTVRPEARRVVEESMGTVPMRGQSQAAATKGLLGMALQTCRGRRKLCRHSSKVAVALGCKLVRCLVLNMTGDRVSRNSA